MPLPGIPAHAIAQKTFDANNAAHDGGISDEDPQAIGEVEECKKHEAFRPGDAFHNL